MAKQTRPNILTGSPAPPPVKYYYSMQTLDLETRSLLNSNVQGFLFKIEARGTDANPDVRIRLAVLNLNSSTNRLVEREVYKYATVEVPLKKSVLDARRSSDGMTLGFAFLSRIQFDWFKELVGARGKLFLADAYVDFGATSSWQSPYARHNYATLKAWVEPTPSQIQSTIRKFGLPSSQVGQMPSVAILPPCPPIWPPFYQDPGNQMFP